MRAILAFLIALAILPYAVLGLGFFFVIVAAAVGGR